MTTDQFDTTNTTNTDVTPTTAPRRRRAVSRPAGPPADASASDAASADASGADVPDTAPAASNTAKKAVSKTTVKKAAAPKPVKAATPAKAAKTAKKTPAKKAPDLAADEPVTPSGRPTRSPRKAAATTEATTSATTRSRSRAAEPADALLFESGPVDTVDTAEPTKPTRSRSRKAPVAGFSAPIDATPAPRDAIAAPASSLMFVAPSAAPAPARRTRKTAAPKVSEPVPAALEPVELTEEELAALALAESEGLADVDEHGTESPADEAHDPRRRRRRGGRGRRRRTGADDTGEVAVDDDVELEATTDGEAGEAGESDEAGIDDSGEGTGSRRRRRRRRSGSDDGSIQDDPPQTVTRVREPRRRGGADKAGSDEVTAVRGSTRLEAKKQRRREGRDAGRRRPSILTEAEFLARREAVDRVMVVRQLADRTQIAVLEDGVLVEHYVNRSSGASMMGNVYLGKVQNVLPSMEAAFVDIGRGRNAVLYAGEVNWDAAGLEGQPKRIEVALKSGDTVLVQVSKDPIGHKGGRLTSQISLPGRFLVYVPEGSMTGISRKLPDTERTRLKSILRKVVPEDAGVIVRTAAEGASEEELSRDVARLTAQWEDIQAKAVTSASSAPTLLYGEPDLAIKVIRDIFNEDVNRLVVSGAGVWDTLEEYVSHVAPDLANRIEKWIEPQDVFAAHRIDEQLLKALDRKVWLPSGGSLVIDRTEAMTVVDVNTGKFIGQGGNLEETVTRNNIEAAEEIVRQLRLRDVGGIIVVDFIDMVLESNRDLVLRRLLECLGRDRTKHQVAEVTSLGLVQMTRKKIGQGLLEVFSENCEHCNGRGVIVHTDPVESKAARSEGSERQLPARRDNEGMAVVAAARSLADKAELADKGEQAGELDDEAENSGSAEGAKGGKSSKSSRSGKTAKHDKSGRGGKTEGGRSRRGRGASHDESNASTPGSDQQPPQDPIASVADAQLATVASVPATATTMLSEAPATPTPRARGTRRRVTRSAGPAQTAELSSDVSTDTP